MTWTETFHCETCGKQKGSVDHWWLAWTEQYRPFEDAPERPLLKIYSWENMSAHDADVKHLCRQSCVQTLVSLDERNCRNYNSYNRSKAGVSISFP